MPGRLRRSCGSVTVYFVTGNGQLEIKYGFTLIGKAAIIIIEAVMVVFIIEKGGGMMGMSDKQYDGFLLDNIEDWEEVIELLENKEYDKALALAEKKKKKNQNKLESPATGANS